VTYSLSRKSSFTYSRDEGREVFVELAFFSDRKCFILKELSLVEELPMRFVTSTHTDLLRFGQNPAATYSNLKKEVPVLSRFSRKLI